MQQRQSIKLTKNNSHSSTAWSWEAVYFIGIGGIGMSALARYFHAYGKRVSGYDKTPSAITKGLEALGINIHYTDAVSALTNETLDPEKTLIVYTPAIPNTHAQLLYFKANNFSIFKRAQVLGQITQNTFCLAVAGTHGKTTTTSILGHIMAVCQAPVTAFLGGISENYQSNLILEGTDVTVVEADEFDRSFLTLTPNIACITAMDADHLDIYGHAEALEAAFKEFANKLKPDGKLFVKNGLPISGITYGIEDDAAYSAHNIRIENGGYVFHVKTPVTTLHNVRFYLPGRHNLSNALVALAMALEYGCPEETVIAALASYLGVERRFSYQIKTPDLVYIDDYAHHPEEILAVHQAVREMYPTDSILVVFQPHLYSRTRDFAAGFATSLSLFDSVILLDIYPAREEPIQGVTAAWLLEKITQPNKQLVSKQDLIPAIKAQNKNIVLTLGAGDIGQEVKHIKQALQHEN
ncbi:UDP-N-acetylmuramate--L-alanine ligase [Bizionia sediminis]|uniref:UDP-N-acetylmuramate--L-alanine ligase n=1 Tax=Bizionia sediminis TaxID=1737064 RepID=A0ABW5KUY0_9FLAO